MLKIEFLYFDKSSCERCSKTDANIKKSLDDLKDVLGKTKVKFQLIEKKLDETQITKSPTILINGKDVEEITSENEPKTSTCSSCSACSGLLNKKVSCRSYFYKGKPYDHIPKAMIKEAIKLSLKQ